MNKGIGTTQGVASPGSTARDGGADDASSELPEGAACAVHPEDAATFLCSRCGSFGCAECAFSEVAGKEACVACARLGLGEPIPWERRKQVGSWRAFWLTTKLASRSPTAFFRTPTTDESVFSAVTHGVLTFTVGLLLSYLLTGALMMLGGGAAAIFVPDEDGQTLGAILGMYGCFIAGMSPLALLMGPANALMGLVFSAAAAHAVLALGKRVKGSFEDTLRAVSYANSPYVWSWVPLLGSFTWPWMIGLEVIGLRETHRCGTDWAVGAAVVYRVVFLLGAVLAYAALVGGVVMMMQDRPPPGW